MPDNIVVDRMYRPLLDGMLRGSPTFRRQCARLAAEPRLSVVLVIGVRTRRSGVRAVTHITRTGAGHLRAIVEIPPDEQIQELIAHEFEHIIEQLDDVDLAAHAALGDTGVNHVGRSRTMFETVRAKRVGVKVASELQP